MEIEPFFNGRPQELKIHKDVFSSGQVDSKIWLCRQLEAMEFQEPLNIFIVGGWCGLLSFLLFSRERLNINQIVSVDRNEDATARAKMINENWIWHERFKAVTGDCNHIPFPYSGEEKGDFLVINTSCEHMESRLWWERIPEGAYVALQSNNMVHEGEETEILNSVDDLVRSYPMDILFKGSLKFDYVPSGGFQRYMTIGKMQSGKK